MGLCSYDGICGSDVNPSACGRGMHTYILSFITQSGLMAAAYRNWKLAPCTNRGMRVNLPVMLALCATENGMELISVPG